MGKGKKAIIAIAAIIAAAGVGIGIYCGATSVDFGEIKLEGIPEKSESATRVMSFNVRCADDDEGSIMNRSKIAKAIIEQYAPDTFGVQEATPRWMLILNSAFKDKYARVGQARDAYGPWTEYSSIFYLKDKYELLDSGTFWLSETPDKKYSKSFESKCSRIATWATLKNKETGEILTHINTHLDHIKETTRVEQCRVLLEEAEKRQFKGTIVCTGDFNTYNDGEVYAAMTQTMDDAAITAKNTDSGITFHAYGKKADEGQGPIDFAFVTKGTEVETYKIIRDTAKDMYPSDHYPLIADIIL